MDYLPIFYSLKDQPCLVVGAGNVARRKVELLLRAGGNVLVVAPKIEPTLEEMAQAGRITYRQEAFRPEVLEGQALVISATEIKEVNREVAQAAHARKLPINVVDDPALSSFILPAIVDRSPLVVAVSSGGRSPVLARLIKARLESLVPVAYGGLTQLAGEFRDKVKAAYDDMEARRKFWERNFQGAAGALFLAGKEKEAREAMEADLAATEGKAPPAGSVTFLPAPAQDPELLPLKALRRLQEADLIVYDPEVLGQTLDMARRDAERIRVGELAGERWEAAEKIPELLVDHAREGMHVVRLFSGENPHPPRAESTALKEATVGHDTIPGVRRGHQ